jgi:altronate dehydratase
MTPAPLDPLSVGRLPAPGDNVAIAVRRLEAGTAIAFANGPRALAHTVLEGHRFAVTPIAAGQPLLSWGLPFGTATTAIAPGDYVCNQTTLDALVIRQLNGAQLPARANFAELTEPYAFDEAAFRPATAVERSTEPRTFLGYRRPGTRGVGTRNVIVILGTTSRTASFARQLAARLQSLARVHPHLDGIVTIAHTEGGGTHEPNNTAEILRALAGFIVHPNVGAVLAVDYGVEPITNARLETFMRERRYALDDVPHAFLSIRGGLAKALADGESILRGWLPEISAQRRTAEPLSGLRIALQCGGSDAFSGVSGNPLAGALVHEVIRHGGTGVLTETDEAVGGEAHLLHNVRELATARALLGKIDGFRARLAWHGITPESNPSGGNKFRGLYNIALKSLGAVHKKDPRTRLDFVTDYADPLGAPGFYFMNGPGNDLEGIAGQVAAGCNLILFVTGNGSITNFPFVPTLKITTTTRRHQLLIHEMDINAGRYLDGEAFTELAAESLDLLVATASGRRTKGEHAGHSQVSLWRNWSQTDTSRLAELRARPAPDGQPLALTAGPTPPPASLQLFPSGSGYATEQVGLILPTSLCAAQVSRLAADRLNDRHSGRARGISRFVALVHTEGCGFGGEAMHQLLHRTYRGYATHPECRRRTVPRARLRKGPERRDAPPTRARRRCTRPLRLGQRAARRRHRQGTRPDRGVVQRKNRHAARRPAPPRRFRRIDGGPDDGRAGDAPTAATLAAVARAIIGAGGSVLLPESDPLLAQPAFRAALLGDTPPHATLAYGQPVETPGLHLVASETDHWVENLTGLGGCGAHLALTVVSSHARQGHPLLPLIQLAEAHERGSIPAEDVDAFLTGDAKADEFAVRALLAAVAQRERTPAASAHGLVDFQLTRGELGVST